MTKQQKLTPVEWEIMDAVWSFENPPSVRDVVDQFFPNGEKAYTTVQTLMNTLEKKGMLKRNKIGLVNFYTPLKSRADMVQTEMTTLISRIFKGSVPAMANFLINSENLSLEEISKIKTLLNEKEKELKGKTS